LRALSHTHTHTHTHPHSHTHTYTHTLTHTHTHTHTHAGNFTQLQLWQVMRALLAALEASAACGGFNKTNHQGAWVWVYGVWWAEVSCVCAYIYLYLYKLDSAFAVNIVWVGVRVCSSTWWVKHTVWCGKQCSVGRTKCCVINKVLCHK